MVRGLSFGSIADQYERYRLGYPDEVVDAVQQYAGRPLRRALEVGAGTGKATRLFAARGIHVTALEPDAEMAHVLRRTCRELPVTPVVTTLEQFQTGDRFDVVFAAAAWHWTDPATRWARAVELLVPGGVLALFGTPAELADPVLAAAVHEIEKQVLAEDDPAFIHPWSLEEMADADGFTDVTRRELARVVSTTSADVVGRHATVSAYLMLSPDARAETLARIEAVLPDKVNIDATVQLSLARRHRTTAR